jgi:hypothetical protein
LSAYFALVPRHLDIKERTGVDDIRDGYPYEEGIDKTKFALDVRDCIISEDLAGLRSLYGNARKTRQNV